MQYTWLQVNGPPFFMTQGVMCICWKSMPSRTLHFFSPPAGRRFGYSCSLQVANKYVRPKHKTGRLIKILSYLHVVSSIRQFRPPTRKPTFPGYWPPRNWDLKPQVFGSLRVRVCVVDVQQGNGLMLHAQQPILIHIGIRIQAISLKENKLERFRFTYDIILYEQQHNWRKHLFASSRTCPL